MPAEMGFVSDIYNVQTARVRVTRIYIYIYREREREGEREGESELGVKVIRRPRWDLFLTYIMCRRRGLGFPDMYIYI